MLDPLYMENDKALENSSGITIVSMKETSKEVNYMEREYLDWEIRFSVEFGSKEPIYK